MIKIVVHTAEYQKKKKNSVFMNCLRVDFVSK